MLWTQRFAFGIDTIDEQHKRLIDMIEEAQGLLGVLDDGIDCYDDIMDLLHQLEAYTVDHFEFEESLLEKAGFQSTYEHIEKHNSFVEKVHETLDSDLDGDQSVALHSIIDFLLQWVSDHILVEDIQYVGVVKASLANA